MEQEASSVQLELKDMKWNIYKRYKLIFIDENCAYHFWKPWLEVELGASSVPDELKDIKLLIEQEKWNYIEEKELTSWVSLWIEHLQSLVIARVDRERHRVGTVGILANDPQFDALLE